MPATDEFADLRDARRRIALFCRRHFQSVMSFYAAPGPSFRLTVDEEIPAGAIAHITTGATCITSLETCSPHHRPPGAGDALRKVGEAFAVAAIERGRWISDGAAEIYCRCRGLPAVVGHLPPEARERQKDKIADHLEKIWSQVEGGRFGVGELAEGNPYPPNCFHTYWALKTYAMARDYVPECNGALLERIGQRVGLVLMWTRQVLGWQVALHAAGSSHRDSDQLAWAVATLLEFASPPFVERDIQALSVAIDSVFTTQGDHGGWPKFEPLFHYPSAGNAYCYTYETFAAVLRCARLPEREFAARAFFKNRESLMRLFAHAERTEVALGTGPGAVGWSSGHHPNRTKPEGWATASVFEFAQELRQLFGVWTRTAAETDLNVA